MPRRIVPERGLVLTSEQKEVLEKRANHLKRQIEGLGKQDGQQLLPDVIIFFTAVERALEQEIFYTGEDAANAALLLDHGDERAEKLFAGETPWITQTGLVVRGFVSKLDDSIQPYGLVVPETFDPSAGRRHRLDIWNHGRNAKGSELSFLMERLTDPGEFTPQDTFVLHPYGRYSNAMKFAGEVDVFEALAHVKTNYPIDEDRICIRGFSMGGAATWHLAAHHAGEWVAATPGAGFAETAEYQQIAERDVPFPWWEQAMWASHDATKYAVNFHQCPTVAYSGELDAQKQAADIMSKYLSKEGIVLKHILGAGMGHQYDDASKADIERWLVPILATGRDRSPSSIRFTTYTLRYNRMRWVQVDGLERHWERGRVDAKISGSTIYATTCGVTALNLSFGAEESPFQPGQAVRVVIDGDELDCGTVGKDRSWLLQLVKRHEGWSTGSTLESLRKRPCLQGPIDDAFMDSFMMVTPTGTPTVNRKVAEWIETELDDAIYQWHMQFRGDVRIAADGDVTDVDIDRHNLVLWGDPSSNRLLERLIEDLPLVWNRESVELGGCVHDSANSVPVLIYPNPLNPDRYVVLNSGFTFAPYGNLSNALQTPKLPDWAVLDIRVPEEYRLTSGVIDCDFFDEQWKVKML